MMAFHRRHPVPFGLLCAGVALMIVALVQLHTESAYKDLFLWAGIGCVIVGNISIAVLRAHEPAQR